MGEFRDEQVDRRMGRSEAGGRERTGVDNSGYSMNERQRGHMERKRTNSNGHTADRGGQSPRTQRVEAGAT